MSLEFLSAEQVEAFGRFTGAPSQSELGRFCVLSDTDVARVRQRHRPQNRLGFAVQLVTVRMLGRFLPDPLEVPWEIVERLDGQVDVDDPSCLGPSSPVATAGRKVTARLIAVAAFVLTALVAPFAATYLAVPVMIARSYSATEPSLARAVGAAPDSLRDRQLARHRLAPE